MRESFILTPELAQAAAQLVYPMFQQAQASGLLKRPCLHIVVMNPLRPFGSGLFEEAILTEVAWGSPAERYAQIARAKAELSWRTGFSAQTVQTQAPFLLTGDNVKWGGSTVRDGLIVACSALDAWMDALFAETLASAITALSLRRMNQMMASNVTFLREFEAGDA